MGKKRFKLSKKIQLRLLNFFVLEVTARSAANVLDLQANTAAFFLSQGARVDCLTSCRR